MSTRFWACGAGAAFGVGFGAAVVAGDLDQLAAFLSHPVLGGLDELPADAVTLHILADD